jgi:hypothetical protein
MRRTAPAVGLGALLLWPSTAEAHGLAGRADLPIPTWLFSWAAAAVLCLSFVGLATLWRRPRLEGDAFHPLPRAVSRALTSRALEVLLGATGLALLLLVIWAGFFGGATVIDNITPTFVYVVFWLGLVAASAVFGDVFRAINPWRAGGRAVGLLLRRFDVPPLPYPTWLGRWPAAATLIGFVWLEVGSSSGDKPTVIATAILVYSTVTWVAMAVWGVETWTRYGEGFSVYFNLFSRVSVFERRGRQIGLRPPLSGLTRLDIVPGTVAVVVAMIGTVSFDGLSAGPSWQDALSPVVDWLRGLGLKPQTAIEISYAVGMTAVMSIVGLFYRVGASGTAGDGPRRFVHSLVPIALAYAAAHYVSLFLFQGQAIAALASDPAGMGWNLFGTASWGIDYGLVSAEAFWYIQLGFVLTGHLAGLVLAHDRALVVHDDVRVASRSQYWMLMVMVGYTVLALWLLSEASKG